MLTACMDDNYCACSAQCILCIIYREEAGFADVSFLAHQSYEEELLPKFVTAAANVTGKCLCTESKMLSAIFQSKRDCT